MYNQAAKDGSIRALNGLGYVYFFGHGDEAPMNKVNYQQHQQIFTNIFNRQNHFIISWLQLSMVEMVILGSMLDIVWSMELVNSSLFIQSLRLIFNRNRKRWTKSCFILCSCC